MRRASAMPLTRAGPNDGDRGLRPRQDGCMGSGVAVTPPSPPLGSYLSALLPRLHAGSGLRSVLLCRGTEARRFRWNGR
jgi:hypothetical protein